MRSRALTLKLDEHAQWRTLLHYSPAPWWARGYRSQVGSAEFFNSPDGSHDSRAELLATLDSFFEPPVKVPQDQDEVFLKDLPEHPQCRFIDRFQWLQEKLEWSPPTGFIQPCPHYEEWRSRVKAESVTLVFSSYFLHNVSSAFGHTLLRLNRSTDPGRSTLLDTAINYGADRTTSNGLVYAVSGIFGGMPGRFANMPYYYKVQEYSNYESRDLWEYELALTAPEVERMLTHLWAVGHVWFPYYFFDRNCSYLLLSLLDVARPGLDLASKVGPWVIPADTVRVVLEAPGLVRTVNVRPSLVTQIRALRTGAPGPRSTEFERVRLLDTELGLLQYTKMIADSKEGSPEHAALDARSKTLLAERNRTPAAVSKEVQEWSNVEAVKRAKGSRPDQGHQTQRLTLGGGLQQGGKSFLEFGYRAAFHDLAADSTGYPPTSAIEALGARMRVGLNTREVHLESLDLVRIISLSPLEKDFGRTSWSLAVGNETVRDLECAECHEWRLGTHWGAALADVDRTRLVYLLGGLQLGLSGGYDPSVRLGPGLESGVLLRFSRVVSLHTSGRWSAPILGRRGAYGLGQVEGRVSLGDQSEARITGRTWGRTSDLMASFGFYF